MQGQYGQPADKKLSAVAADMWREWGFKNGVMRGFWVTVAREVPAYAGESSSLVTFDAESRIFDDASRVLCWLRNDQEISRQEAGCAASSTAADLGIANVWCHRRYCICTSDKVLYLTRKYGRSFCLWMRSICQWTACYPLGMSLPSTFISGIPSLINALQTS